MDNTLIDQVLLIYPLFSFVITLPLVHLILMKNCIDDVMHQQLDLFLFTKLTFTRARITFNKMHLNSSNLEQTKN